jgi:hypothetical protein
MAAWVVVMAAVVVVVVVVVVRTRGSSTSWSPQMHEGATTSHRSQETHAQETTRRELQKLRQTTQRTPSNRLCTYLPKVPLVRVLQGHIVQAPSPSSFTTTTTTTTATTTTTTTTVTVAGPRKGCRARRQPSREVVEPVEVLSALHFEGDAGHRQQQLHACAHVHGLQARSWR